MAKRTILDKLVEEAEETEAELIENIDAAIEKIDARLAPYERLRAKKEQLQRAKNALQGGTRLTGSGSTRLSQEQVIAYLRDNPGETLGEIAEGLERNTEQIRGHLYRGKDERFLTKDGKWYLRDPKNGINTAEDIPDEDEDED